MTFFAPLPSRKASQSDIIRAEFQNFFGGIERSHEVGRFGRGRWSSRAPKATPRARRLARQHIFLDGPRVSPSVTTAISTIPLSGFAHKDGESSERTTRGRVLPHFIVGPENALAAHAVRELLQALHANVLGGAPGGTAAFIPLLIHGPTGLGKSHLAHGLADQARLVHGASRVACLSGNDFARQYADSLERDTTATFLARLRGMSLLVVDDVGQLAGRVAAQREFCLTLDELAARGAWFVGTALSPPGAIPRLSSALVSRLSSALCARLSPPSVATRRAAIRDLAVLLKLKATDEALDYLATNSVTTIPGLSGALLYVSMLAQSEKLPIDLALVKRYLDAREEPSLQGIASRTARHYAIHLADLRSASRRRSVVQARGVAMYLARQLTRKSLAQIGDFFGGRDHSTVLHGCRQTEGLLASDPDTRQAVSKLKHALSSC